MPLDKPSFLRFGTGKPVLPHADSINATIARANEIILGKDREIQLTLACLFGSGHLLIEDVPGVGKTTLAHTLAKLLGLQFSRVQFTSDLLPGDVLGASIFDRETSQFRFHQGPVFTNVLLADEINRASPKAQSALLEAMEERQVSVDGQTRKLPEPFFVIATQNPTEQVGTFPLPESQLDRFLMRVSLGYPAPEAERALYKGEERRNIVNQLAATMDPVKVRDIQLAVPTIKVTDALIDYLQAIVQYTRNSNKYAIGLSPRAGLALRRASQAWAALVGRDHVLPEDVQAVLKPVIGHRLHGIGDHARATFDVGQDVLTNVAIP
jgi:MoxR-like ATPase